MTGYIDVDKFNREMYHAAFETFTYMQRWDSGCWIRYKLYENVLSAQEPANVVPKEKYDKLLEKYNKLLENATILAESVGKYQKMIESVEEVKNENIGRFNLIS